jgi:hypothetical protein
MNSSPSSWKEGKMSLELFDGFPGSFGIVHVLPLDQHMPGAAT